MSNNIKQIDDLDSADQAILAELQKDGRLSNVELAKRIHLSPPAAHVRRKRLEDEGYLEQYSAVLNRKKMGYDMLCFIHLHLQMHQPENVARIPEEAKKLPEILECHHVTGEYDYLLKVIVRDREDLEDFIVNRLMPIPGIARIRTSLVLREIKSTTSLPLE
ncbi:MAG: Lrp/AsnC family transcriptional regulator [SAR324 cluster bacterium]|nr:Lrp/AsnC family transcriptional regulator [SAR324 cluster bacterium]MBL7034236.1 Lrp/AsnC family transcriptional regulator [SAR324 cluster bacterium]